MIPFIPLHFRLYVRIRFYCKAKRIKWKFLSLILPVTVRLPDRHLPFLLEPGNDQYLEQISVEILTRIFPMALSDSVQSRSQAASFRAMDTSPRINLSVSSSAEIFGGCSDTFLIVSCTSSPVWNRPSPFPPLHILPRC